MHARTTSENAFSLPASDGERDLDSDGVSVKTRGMLPRRHWQRHIARLDPERDYQEIYRIVLTHEFPWDMNQSLSFALFRTYAVPSIGRLLDQTGHFENDTQRRYDDTALLLDEPSLHGLHSDRGRRAIRRINQMHGAYDISNDDMRYVLSTFVVVPEAVARRLRLAAHVTGRGARERPLLHGARHGSWASRTSPTPTRASTSC